jgi:hypothetical protein
LKRLGIEESFAKPQFRAVEADPIIAATPPRETEDVADALGVLSGAASATKAGGNRRGVIGRSHVCFPHAEVIIGPIHRRQVAGATAQQCRDGIADRRKKKGPGLWTQPLL